MIKISEKQVGTLNIKRITTFILTQEIFSEETSSQKTDYYCIKRKGRSFQKVKALLIY